MIQKKTAIIIVVLAAAILGGLYAIGAFTADDAKMFGRSVYYKSKGTVEGAVGTVSDINTARGSGDPAKARECVGNLRRIESAKRAAANTLALGVGEVPENEVIGALGGSMPRCPDGGRYRINPLGSTPTCSIGAQNVSVADDDHVLINY